MKKGETYDNTCVVDRYRKNNSWMFWGSFAGIERGPCVFWEADWGKMTSEGYRQHILPLVVDWYRNRRQETGRAYLFMHVNAPVHKAPLARDYLMAHGIQPISWPAYSPDLNPIENVWDIVKDYIQFFHSRLYGEMEIRNNELRKIVKAAWDDNTKPEKLEELIKSMPKRYDMRLLFVPAVGLPNTEPS